MTSIKSISNVRWVGACELQDALHRDWTNERLQTVWLTSWRHRLGGATDPFPAGLGNPTEWRASNRRNWQKTWLRAIWAAGASPTRCHFVARFKLTPLLGIVSANKKQTKRDKMYRRCTVRWLQKKELLCFIRPRGSFFTTLWTHYGTSPR